MQASRALVALLIGARVRLRALLPRGSYFIVGYTGRWLVRQLERLDRRAIQAGIAPLRETLNRPPTAPVRVAIVNAALASGGAERQIVNLAIGLSKKIPPACVRFVGLHLNDATDLTFFQTELERHCIDVCSPMSDKSAEEHLSKNYGSGAVERLRQSLSWAPNDFAAHVIRLAAEFDRWMPTVVHGWQDAAGLAAAFAAHAIGINRVLVAGRNLSPTHFSIYRPFMKKAYLYLAAQTETVLLNNSAAGAADYARWLGVSGTRFRIVRNGVTLHSNMMSSPSATRAAFGRELGIPTHAVIIGSIFRFQTEKRPLLWLEVASYVGKRLPSAHFVLQGTGTMLGKIRARAAALRLSERLHIRDPTRDIAAAIASFDVLLLTSRLEGTPNVVLEAAALGTPSVVTAGGGAAETVIHGETGLVVPKSDQETGATYVGLIGDTVIEALRLFTSREATQRAGQEFVSIRYGCSRMVDETWSLYGAGEHHKHG